MIMKKIKVTAAAAVASTSSSGLVKSLLIPSYADSGSNGAFRNDDDDGIVHEEIAANVQNSPSSSATAEESMDLHHGNHDTIATIIGNKSVLSNGQHEQQDKKQEEVYNGINSKVDSSPQIIEEEQRRKERIQPKQKEMFQQNNSKHGQEGSIINENESTTASLTTINLNGSSVVILTQPKEEENESIHSNDSVNGSEPSNTVLDPDIIWSKPCRSKAEGITEEMLQKIREEEEPLERWKEENKTNTPKRKKFGMFPMTTPASEEPDALEWKNGFDFPVEDTSDWMTPSNKQLGIRTVYSSPLARARQCFTPEIPEIASCQSYTSPTRKKQGGIPQSHTWEGADFVPKTLALQPNQRIPLQQLTPELEDAHDVLSLLVEKSLSMDKDKPALEQSISNMEQIQEDLQTLSELSSTHPNHSSHVQTLDTLLSSHTYALEMKQAAFSASTIVQTTQTNADDKIQQLNEELSKCRAEIGRLKSKEEFTSPNRSILDNDDSSSATSVAEELASLKEAMHTNSSSTVNVQMLNSENFQTDWTELSPPLPPPPDHSLYSPIISSLLNQWTPDPNLHSSLLTWMEQVLHPPNKPPFPPLKITNMDHTIKEGFIMHLLPLLLRRSDVQIQVLTRAERKTTYDIGVTVTSSPVLESKRMTTNSLQRMAFHASKDASDSVTSTSLTSPVSNSHSELTVFPSPEEPKKGFISSMTNSLNTLLKPQPKPIPNAHPYHRVVSVPPGRIGVTFVDFRGHAMVSDVSPQSPLQGWVFPSDVLIAIDEVPVSGMRVKDIVNLLKGRMGRQRALRVISSRDMTELTNG